MQDYDTGKESEWNEASLKSRRLDDIQSLINFYRMNPLGISEGKFNYENLLMAIGILYGEGRSKYKESEKKEIDKLKELINKLIKLMPPHIPCYKDGISGGVKSFIFNQDNYDKIMETLYIFEMKVKDYNDEHGLTTKNKGASGLF